MGEFFIALIGVLVIFVIKPIWDWENKRAERIRWESTREEREKKEEERLRRDAQRQKEIDESYKILDPTPEMFRETRDFNERVPITEITEKYECIKQDFDYIFGDGWEDDLDVRCYWGWRENTDKQLRTMAKGLYLARKGKFLRICFSPCFRYLIYTKTQQQNAIRFMQLMEKHLADNGVYVGYGAVQNRKGSSFYPYDSKAPVHEFELFEYSHHPENLVRLW